MLIWGETGCGKSFATAAIVRDVVMRTRGEVTIAMTTHAALDLAIRNTFGSASRQSEAEVLERYLKCDLLWLEDIGAGVGTTEFTRRTLEVLIDHRLQNCLPILATSNLSVEQIEAVFGERVGSRLHEYKIVRLVGSDRRRANAG